MNIIALVLGLLLFPADNGSGGPIAHGNDSGGSVSGGLHHGSLIRTQTQFVIYNDADFSVNIKFAYNPNIFIAPSSAVVFAPPHAPSAAFIAVYEGYGRPTSVRLLVRRDVAAAFTTIFDVHYHDGHFDFDPSYQGAAVRGGAVGHVLVYTVR